MFSIVLNMKLILMCLLKIQISKTKNKHKYFTEIEIRIVCCTLVQMKQDGPRIERF